MGISSGACSLFSFVDSDNRTAMDERIKHGMDNWNYSGVYDDTRANLFQRKNF